jgi:hypothetical protein
MAAKWSWWLGGGAATLSGLPVCPTTASFKRPTLLRLQMVAIHIKLKRRESTLFLLVEASDTMLKIKHRLSEALSLPLASIHLYGATDKSVAYTNESILGDHKAKAIDGGVIYYTLEASEAIAIPDATA